jgi:hypothetical protein
MTGRTGFAFAQARLQARVALLLPNEEWRHLDAVRALAPYLEEARSTRLAPLVARFSTSSTHHDIEVALRVRFSETVLEIAEWVPGPWRSAIRCVDELWDLTLLQHLYRHRKVPAWMSRLPRFAPHLADDEVDTRDAINRLLQPRLDILGADSLLDAWLNRWRALWPRAQHDHHRNLDILVKLVHGHLVAFARTPPGEAWASRRDFQRRVRFLFRRCCLQPAAVVSYLCLYALELERLRGSLLNRIFLPVEKPA